MSTRRSDQSSQEFFPPPAEVGLGIATDVEARFPTTRLIHVADGHVLYTPSRPDYRDGNMTYLRQPPTPSNDWVWRAAEAMVEHKVPHIKVGWEQPIGSDPINLGEPFKTVCDVVMTRASSEVEARDEAFVELTTDDDLAAMTELDEVCAAEWNWPKDFVSWYAGQTRERVKRGVARWFAMQEAGEIVATAGLVVTKDGLRFQDVQTRPNKRRQGWATRLIQSMVSDPSNGGTADYVIVAEQGGVAEKLYRDLGFQTVSQLVTATAGASTSVDQ